MVELTLKTKRIKKKSMRTSRARTTRRTIKTRITKKTKTRRRTRRTKTRRKTNGINGAKNDLQQSTCELLSDCMLFLVPSNKALCSWCSYHLQLDAAMSYVIARSRFCHRFTIPGLHGPP